MQGKILVVGSINMDLVVGTTNLPSLGETVKGNTIRYIPGGKGANQAIAAARLGGKVSFIGKVGSDNFGKELLSFLEGEKLDVAGITQSQEFSGIALITVDGRGENTIVVVPGSNAEVTSSYIEKNEQLIVKSDIILAQYEIPLGSINTL